MDKELEKHWFDREESSEEELEKRWDELREAIYDDAERKGFVNENIYDLMEDIREIKDNTKVLKHLRWYRKTVTPNVPSWSYRIYTQPYEEGEDEEGAFIVDPWENHLNKCHSVQQFLSGEIDLDEFKNSDYYTDWKNLVIYDLMISRIDELIQKYTADKQQKKDPTFNSLVGGEKNSKKIKSILNYFGAIDEYGRFKGKYELNQEIIILIHALAKCRIIESGKWATTARVFCGEFHLDFTEYIRWEASRRIYKPKTTKRLAYDEYVNIFSEFNK